MWPPVAERVLSGSREAFSKPWKLSNCGDVVLPTAADVDQRLRKLIELKPAEAPQKKGRLTVVGTGMCVDQLTLGAITHLLAADVVVYVVADRLTERALLQLRPDAVDFYPFYDEGKPRETTYFQEKELLLRCVRAGLDVVAAFYGHPGVFCDPGHQAIWEAKREGYEARMLPAVSAEDCLYAELGVDPAFPGVQSLEATDFLAFKRELCTECNVLLWQAGCVCDLRFSRKGVVREGAELLVDRLIEIYGEGHKVVPYVFSPLAPAPSEGCALSLRDLRATATCKLTAITTLYIPPLGKPLERDEGVALRFGFDSLPQLDENRAR
eukprot:TRINITY_DN1152_c0_g1_i1.p1 TRINITY_DN1152_c0_g1~~TRINITY_DN1152_c0_g1_i1.p1  ORF type:complete len:325 (-),score=71.46 TRINITY_DN1152_c0_g1_i1:778-1752(-)